MRHAIPFEFVPPVSLSGQAAPPPAHPISYWNGMEDAGSQGGVQSVTHFVHRIKLNIPELEGKNLSENSLLKWLRFQHNDLKATEEALKKHLIFRRAWGLDELDKWEKPPIMEKYFGHGFLGTDREGSPVLLNLLGKLDVEGLFQSCQSKDYIKMHLSNVEKGLRLAAKATNQKTEEKLLLVMDLSGMTTSHYSYKPFTNTFLTFVALFQEHYPDILKKIIVIKAPSIAQIGYNFLRPFLCETTTAVVEMPGDEWKEVLFEYVDPEKWPAYWGGYLTENGEEKCPSKVNYGIDIVSEADYYDPSKDDEDYTEVTVYAGNAHSVEVEIENEGTVLRWKYKTVMEDIGFSIYVANPKTDSLDVVYPYIRLECSLVPVENEMVCDRKGIYVLEFDNKYSWFSAKELSYSVRLGNEKRD